MLTSLLILLTLPGLVSAQSPNVGLLSVASVSYPRQVAPSSSFTVTIDVEYAVRTNATIRATVVSGSINAGGQVLWESQTENVSGGGDKAWTFGLTAPPTEGTKMEFTFIAYFFDNGSWSYFNDTQSGPGYVEINLKVGNLANLTINLGYGNIPISVDNFTQNTSPDGTVTLTRQVGKTYWITVLAVVQLNNSTRLVFNSWTDGNNVTTRNYLVDGDTYLTGTYRVQYLVQINAPVSTYASSGWYDKGSNVTLSVDSSVPMNSPLGMLGMKYNFEGWSGDVNSQNKQLNVTVNGPMTVNANFIGDYSGLAILIIPVIGSAGGILLFLLRKTRSKGTTEERTSELSEACRNCGKPLEEGWTHCIHCGTSLGSPEGVKN